MNLSTIIKRIWQVIGSCIVLCLLGVLIYILVSNWDIVDYKYFKKDGDNLIYRPIVIDSTSAITLQEQQSAQQNDCNSYIDKILSTNNDIASVTSNILEYFSIIIAALALICGLGIWKYYKKYSAIEQEIEKLNNSVLDNARIILYAVPFTQATHITSSKYLKAIKHIATLVGEKKEIVEKKPEYVELLLCQGLYKFFQAEYKDAIIVLEEAKNLLRWITGNEQIKEIISYHLARTYKQYAYSIGEKFNWDLTDYKKQEITDLLQKAEECATKSPKWLLETVQVSIELIRQKIANIADEKLTQKITSIIQGKDKFSFAKMVLIPYYIEYDPSNQTLSQQKQNAKDFISYMESRLDGNAGDNILASWYLSMARVCVKCNMKTKANLYYGLSKMYFNQIENNDEIQTLFTYDYLTEIRKNLFKEKLIEINKKLNKK